MRRLTGRAVALALTGVTLACTAGGGSPGGTEQGGASEGEGAANGRAGIRIVFVTHGQSADPFWSLVANGAQAAARDLGVRVEYQAPVSFAMVAMANLLDAAVVSRPSGLVVSIPDANALGPSVRSAVEAGIPVVSSNAGADSYRELGVLVHIGQPEFDAGVAAGERLWAAGARRALCVNQEVGNVSLDRRCEGFKLGMERSGGTTDLLVVELADPDDAQQRVQGALASDPSIDGILALGPTGAAPALAAVREAGRLGEIRLATFDLSPEVIDAIVDGSMLFAVDQQPYLQGYLPIVTLVNYLETLALPGGGEVVKTGPGFVTAETAEQVRALTRQGLR